MPDGLVAPEHKYSNPVTDPSGAVEGLMKAVIMLADVHDVRDSTTVPLTVAPVDVKSGRLKHPRYLTSPTMRNFPASDENPLVVSGVSTPSNNNFLEVSGVQHNA